MTPEPPISPTAFDIPTTGYAPSPLPPIAVYNRKTYRAMLKRSRTKKLEGQNRQHADRLRWLSFQKKRGHALSRAD